MRTNKKGQQKICALNLKRAAVSLPAALICFFWGIRLSAPLQDHRLPGSGRSSAGRSIYIENPENGS